MADAAAKGDQMPAISLEELRHVAKLSRLELTDQELHQLAGELGSILHYVAMIREVDVSGVGPMAHTLALSNVLRDDVAGPALSPEAVLQNAPETDGPFFKVPKVIASEDSAG